MAFALTILKPIHILNTNQPKQKLAYRSRPCFYREKIELRIRVIGFRVDLYADDMNQNFGRH